MSTGEQLSRLYPRHDRTKFNASSAAELGKIVADVQRIHDPSVPWLVRAFRTSFWHHIDLRARPHGNANALFEADMSRDDIDREVTVRMFELELPGQAAGWAALQLYREQSTGLTLPSLSTTDPREETFEKSLERISALANEARDEAITSVFQRVEGELSITTSGFSAPSEVRVDNYRQRSLPGVLGVIKAGYDELYPGANTSEAVAGIVGATNLEAFTEAWQKAAEYEPVDGARMLIESDAFVANR